MSEMTGALEDVVDQGVDRVRRERYGDFAVGRGERGAVYVMDEERFAGFGSSGGRNLQRVALLLARDSSLSVGEAVEKFYKQRNQGQAPAKRLSEFADEDGMLSRERRNDLGDLAIDWFNGHQSQVVNPLVEDYEHFREKYSEAKVIEILCETYDLRPDTVEQKLDMAEV